MTTKSIYASSESEARARAKRIALLENISGNLSLQEKPDASGGIYYLAIWN